MIIALIVIAGLVVLSIGFMAYKRISPIGLGMHKPVYHTGGIALDGYDVTTYFKGAAEKGSSSYSIIMKDVTWYFISESNLKEFTANPEKYIPEFGGYCTKAVSTGFAAPADPTIFSVFEDRLYIFSSEEVKAEFIKDPKSLINACSKKWK